MVLIVTTPGCDQIIPMLRLGDTARSPGLAPPASPHLRHRPRAARVEVADRQRLEVVAHLDQQRVAGRDLEAGDRLVADREQVLGQGPQAVAVGGDQQVLALAQGGLEALLPDRHDALERDLQRLAPRQQPRRHVAVARVVARMRGIVAGERWRRHVVAAAPDADLLVTVAGRRLGLVQALQPAVVALVQAPALDLRQPHHVELVEDDPERADGALQDRGVGEVEAQALGLQEAPGEARLLDAALAEVDVDPAGEAVLLVPVALAVAHHHEDGHRSLPGYAVLRAACALIWAKTASTAGFVARLVPGAAAVAAPAAMPSITARSSGLPLTRP